MPPACIGYFTAFEEGEESKVRCMFEVNVFGMHRMINAELPDMLIADQRISVLQSGSGADTGVETRARVLDRLGTVRPTLLDADAYTGFQTIRLIVERKRLSAIEK